MRFSPKRSTGAARPTGTIAAAAAAERDGAQEGGGGSKKMEVTHATWHVPASPAPHVAVQAASAYQEGTARTVEGPYSRARPAHGMGERKPSFNMKVLVQ